MVTSKHQYNDTHQNGNGAHIHAVLFPFISKGHTIPILHLARLLLRRQISVTVFTTPANRDFISSSLPASSTTSILELSFLHDIPESLPASRAQTSSLPCPSSLNSPFPLKASVPNSIPPWKISVPALLSWSPTASSGGPRTPPRNSESHASPSTACPTTHLLRRGRWGGRWRRLASRRQRAGRCRSRKSCGGKGRRFGWSELGFFFNFLKIPKIPLRV
ncbi:UDP-glycosyltransferase 90A2 [Linum perenne]